MSSPPTVSADGSTQPAGQTNAYTLASNTDVFRVAGGEPYLSGTHSGKVRSSIIGATGGNLSVNDGSTGSYSRITFRADAAKVSVVVKPRATPHRFLVDGQYVDTTGTITATTTGTVNEYISLTFASRGLRVITVEMEQNEAFVGVNVGATEKVYAPEGGDILTSVLLGDSYAFGSTATRLGDGWGAVMADWLGLAKHSNSGSSGTGWATSSNYRFDERIANGDLSLGGDPDVIFLMGSYNDRSLSAATVTANCLTGLRSARAAHPRAPIFVFGVFPGATGPSAGVLSTEAAVEAAVNSFGDALAAFIPVSTIATGALITGTGKVGTTTGTGNSDIYTDTDGVHPPTAGHAFIGKWAAQQVLAAAASLR